MVRKMADPLQPPGTAAREERAQRELTPKKKGWKAARWVVKPAPTIL